MISAVCGGARRVAIDDRDARPLAREPHRRRSPDSGRRPRDHRNAIGEPTHGCSPSCDARVARRRQSRSPERGRPCPLGARSAPERGADVSEVQRRRPRAIHTGVVDSVTVRRLRSHTHRAPACSARRAGTEARAPTDCRGRRSRGLSSRGARVSLPARCAKRAGARRRRVRGQRRRPRAIHTGVVDSVTVRRLRSHTHRAPARSARRAGTEARAPTIR